jgi:hypothetical protein
MKINGDPNNRTIRLAVLAGELGMTWHLYLFDRASSSGKVRRRYWQTRHTHRRKNENACRSSGLFLDVDLPGCRDDPTPP